MTEAVKKTLRLLMPQWQGGNLPAYGFGAQLLAWLAPPALGTVAQVEVTPPSGDALPLERGIVGRSQLLAQAKSAREIIDQHSPDRIVVLGGDCLVDLAPFAYLNERYDGELAVLWVDAHPDVITPEHFSHAHAMVLGNLLGQGDQDFVSQVKRPIAPEKVLYAGLDDMNDAERSIVDKLGLKAVGSGELAKSSAPVVEWIRATGVRHLAIHLDLDVLDPKEFRSLLFARPDAADDEWDGIPQGKMSIRNVVRLLKDVAAEVDVVALGITEHLPWDAMALRDMLAELPLLSDQA